MEAVTKLPFCVPSIGEEEIEAAADAMRSGWLSAGPKVKEFEAAFAKYVDAPEAVATGSGTVALAVALGSLDLHAGHDVYVPAITFPATANVVRWFGARPVLVDVDEHLGMDPSSLQEAILETLRQQRQPAAVMPVHMGGRVCRMPEIEEIAELHHLWVVEDAAHALPARRQDGRLVGAWTANERHWRRMTAFSFYATKNLTTGEGGMLTGPPQQLARARPWVLHGMSRDAFDRHRGGSWFFDVVAPGFKGNMTDPAAAIGLVQLRRLAELQWSRGIMAQCYTGQLRRELPTVVSIAEWDVRESADAWHLYQVLLPADLPISRDEVIDRVGKLGVSLNVHFTPLHLLTEYASPTFRQHRQLPAAEALYRRLVSLPLHPGMVPSDVDRVVGTLRTVLEAARV